jgi:amino acid transporter
MSGPLQTASADIASVPLEAAGHPLSRQLTLRDLVLSQVLCVVGSAWVGIAAGLGRAQGVVWLIAFGTFYLPMAAAVFYLNRALPLEGGLYAWARSAFGDAAGFLVAWNIWGYGLTSIATILFQIPSEFAFMVGPEAAWIPESHAVVLSFMAVALLLLALCAARGLALGKWIHNVSGAASRLHPRYRTPTNSILVAAVVVGALVVLASVGVHAAEAFAMLNNASNILYCLAYMAMFVIPLAGVKALRDRIPRWVAALSAVGFCATLFSCVTNVYPFVDVRNPLDFAVKLIATTALTNFLGFGFYRSRMVNAARRPNSVAG